MATTVNINQSASSRLLEEAFAQFPNIMAQYRSMQQQKKANVMAEQAHQLDLQKFAELQQQNELAQENYAATVTREQENWQKEYDIRHNQYLDDKTANKNQKMMSQYLTNTTGGQNYKALHDPTQYGRDPNEFLPDGVTPNPSHNLSPAFGHPVRVDLQGFEEYKKNAEALGGNVVYDFDTWYSHAKTRNKAFIKEQAVKLNQLKGELSLNPKITLPNGRIVDGRNLSDAELNKVMNQLYNAQVVYDNIAANWGQSNAADTPYLDYSPVSQVSATNPTPVNDPNFLQKTGNWIKRQYYNELTGEYDLTWQGAGMTVATILAAYKGRKIPKHIWNWLMKKPVSGTKPTPTTTSGGGGKPAGGGGGGKPPAGGGGKPTSGIPPAGQPGSPFVLPPGGGKPGGQAFNPNHINQYLKRTQGNVDYSKVNSQFARTMENRLKNYKNTPLIRRPHMTSLNQSSYRDFVNKNYGGYDPYGGGSPINPKNQAWYKNMWNNKANIAKGAATWFAPDIARTGTELLGGGETSQDIAETAGELFMGYKIAAPAMARTLQNFIPYAMNKLNKKSPALAKLSKIKKPGKLGIAMDIMTLLITFPELRDLWTKFQEEGGIEEGGGVPSAPSTIDPAGWGRPR